MPIKHMHDSEMTNDLNATVVDVPIKNKRTHTNYTAPAALSITVESVPEAYTAQALAFRIDNILSTNGITATIGYHEHEYDDEEDY